jgi:CubicO group peptidase (beta-lactamase class C family)
MISPPVSGHRWTPRRLGAICLAAAAAVATPAFAFFRPDRVIEVATGLTARTLCSETFVSGLAPDRIFAESLKPTPGFGLLAHRLHYRVDPKTREVRADWAGLFHSRAVYRGAAGCVLWRSSAPPPAPPVLAAFDATPALPEIAGPELVAPADPALDQALARMFAEPVGGPPRYVRAVVIVHDGRVIAERYAPGVGIDTPLFGYSLTKTVTSALVGVLAGEGRLKVDAPAPVAAWRRAGDPRGGITVDNLLRMDSGLAAEETDSGFDPTSRMLYAEPDMAAFAERARLKHPPGTVWEYESPNTLLLSRIIEDTVGGHEADALNFARSALFGPLGMRTAVLETDAAGTPVGSQSMLASARDWAKLGQLYLDDGMAGARRILPEGWVAYSRRSTLGSEYGAGLWTNSSTSGNALARVIRGGMPADAFFGSGHLGQRIYVLPSQRLVIVRMGVTHQPGFDIQGDLRLIRAAIAATGRTPSP